MKLSSAFRALLTSALFGSAAVAQFASGEWSLVQDGTSGVSALEMAVVSETTVMILDKVEHNPLQTTGHFAWGAELDLITRTVRPLNPTSNTWCGTGSFLSNGTMVSSGGHRVVLTGNNGLAAVRLFDPCEDKNCDIIEDENQRRMASLRWYPSSVRLEDGSALIMGGSWENNIIDMPNITNPTYEFFPPKNIHGQNGTPIYSQFIHDALNANHFPILIQLPDGNLFVAANQMSMIFDWKTNQEIMRLPNFPNGVRVTSPLSAGATLLPLTPENNYTPEVLICGGSSISDELVHWSRGATDSQAPTSDQCVRMVLNEEGIAKGWEVDHMPVPRIMAELVLLPDGRVIMVNGARTGIAGYGTSFNPIGDSDCDNPVFNPVLYDPSAPLGERFTEDGLPVSDVARMYHSTATMTPNGTILLAGSNPNDDVTTVKWGTEYRLEWLDPPYMQHTRPTYTGLSETFDYNQTVTLDIDIPEGAQNVSAVIMDFGFATHAVHMDQRLVGLVSELSDDKTQLTITGPPSPTIYSPGPAFVFVLVDGVPSFGHKTLIGTGAQPPFDQGAFNNVMSQQPLYWDQWMIVHKDDAAADEDKLFSTLSGPASTPTGY